MTTDAVPGVADPAEGPAVPEPSAPNIAVLPDGNTVTLHPKVTIQIGIAARATVRNTLRTTLASGRILGKAESVEEAIVEGAIAEVYLRLGVTDWTFTDTKGKPEPITEANIIRLLPYGGGGRQVAELADDLYSPEIFPSTPLPTETSKSLPGTQTAASMSQMNGIGRKHRTPSGRSSRNGTAGKRSGVRGR